MVYWRQLVCFLITGLEITFEESDYSIKEGGTLRTDIRFKFRNNQNPFSVHLCPVNISTAEAHDLGFFIDYDNIEIISRATAGELQCMAYAHYYHKGGRHYAGMAWMPALHFQASKLTNNQPFYVASYTPARITTLLLTGLSENHRDLFCE